jgi:hypothetical protein
MSVFRNVIAAAALAVVGAGTANATVLHPNSHINTKMKFRFCTPHLERKIVHRGHSTYLVTYSVNRLCHKHVVSVRRLPYYHHAGR